MVHDHGAGGSGQGHPVFRYDGHRLSAHELLPVVEFPIRLTVNGIRLATLIGSPHDVEFLVAGFLRTQRWIASREDIEFLGVCPDSGVANVKIRGEAPERPHPILTSGCTGGVTYHLPQSGRAGDAGGRRVGERRKRFSPSDLLRAMEELGRAAGMYRSTGGIHSSAVADEGEILLHAEDIGRHNTIDRIAGEALLKEVDLAEKILVTSGRISSEMAVKGESIGVSAMASRTSPTDMAIRISEEAGITLVGYVRAGGFTVYTHPWRILVDREGAGSGRG